MLILLDHDGVRAMLKVGHDVQICISPLTPWHCCVAEKYAWVEQYLGAEFTQRMILTKDKTLIRGDVLVDDKPIIRAPRRRPGGMCCSRLRTT